MPKHNSRRVEHRQIAGDGKGLFDSPDDIDQEVAVRALNVLLPCEALGVNTPEELTAVETLMQENESGSAARGRVA